MTETVLSSATREVVIGFDRPFVIIGERINPTGRKKLAAEMKAGDFDTVDRRRAGAGRGRRADARRQRRHPARRRARDPAPRRSSWCSRSPTCRSRSTRRSSRRSRPGLAVYQGKALVNSVTGEDERLERVLPLVAKYGAAVVAISNDETGISEDPDVRFAVAQKIVSRAADYGIPKRGHRRRPAGDADRRDGHGRAAGVPAGAPAAGGARRQHHLRRVERQLRPARTAPALNAAFLPMAIASGLTSAITSPLHDEVRQAIMGRRRDDGQRRGLRDAGSRASASPARRRRPVGAAGARAGARAAGARPRERGLARAGTDRRAEHARRLHAVGHARPFRDGTTVLEAARRARRRHRLGLRRPRHLRPLPGRGQRGRVRQARRSSRAART